MTRVFDFYGEQIYISVGGEPPVHTIRPEAHGFAFAGETKTTFTADICYQKVSADGVSEAVKEGLRHFRITVEEL